MNRRPLSIFDIGERSLNDRHEGHACFPGPPDLTEEAKVKLLDGERPRSVHQRLSLQRKRAREVAKAIVAKGQVRLGLYVRV